MTVLMREEERRRFLRVRVNAPLRYQLIGAQGFSNTVLENVSLGGVGFINDKFITPMTKLSLEVELLSRVLYLRGKIAWAASLSHSDKYHLGVEFSEVSLEDKNYLHDFLEIQAGRT